MVGTAPNGRIALIKIYFPKYKPDIIIMDILLPEMDGYEIVSHIMNRMPIPVIIVSALNQADVNLTLTDLNLPAFASRAIKFVKKTDKNNLNDEKRFKNELIEKIIILSKTNPPPLKSRLDFRSFLQTIEIEKIFRKINLKETSKDFRRVLITIGASAGSTQAILFILSKIPAEFPPILIVEHTPEEMTPPYVEWLQSLFPHLDITVAMDGVLLRSNRVYIAPGGKQCIVNKMKTLQVYSNEYRTPYNPSIDKTFISATRIYGSGVIGIILSGLSATDTLEGVRKIKSAGGVIIAEHESTCIFYAMPKEIIDEGLADEIVPAFDIPSVIHKYGYI